MRTEKVAQILGVSKSTILRWISTGLIKDVTRDKRGWRIWSNTDIQRVIRFKDNYWGTQKNSFQNVLGNWRSEMARSLSTFPAHKYARRNHKEGNNE